MQTYGWSGRIAKLLLCMVLFSLIQVGILRFIDPPITPNVAFEWAEAVMKRTPQKYPDFRWKNIREISPHLRRAVIASEDQLFPHHSGFDFNQIRNAYQSFLKENKMRGASTISMQTARSVFLLSSRSILRKLTEIYYTALIEIFWSKHRILEMYLNTVDWGTGLTGAEAASRKYFSKSALHLTREEAALMAAILPNPHRWSVNTPSPYIRLRQAQILKTMHTMPLL